MKDFDKWNDVKKYIHNTLPPCMFKERDMRWCKLGINIGHEENGKGDEYERPVLVLRKFNYRLCWVVPLTTQLKKNPFYVSCGKHNDIERMAIISQIRLLDSSRFTEKIGVVPIETFELIKKAIKDLL